MKKFLVILISTLFACVLKASVSLPKLISDGMVLQRDQKVKIWGWASPGEKVEIKLNDEKYSAITNQEGKWFVTLKPHASGTNYQLNIKASNMLTVSNIAFGDVWLCSGQSNMELPMRRVKPLYENIITNAHNDLIRIFSVPQSYNFKTAQEDYASGKWLSVNEKSIQNFSALAYFFADSIFKKYHVPVGILNASLGGSPAEAWMSEDALKSFPELLKEACRWRNDELIKQTEEYDTKKAELWYGLANKYDKGSNNISWKSEELNDSDWCEFSIPGYWNKKFPSDKNGIFWFRKNFILSEADLQSDAFLNLGRIIDADSVFINGNFVGHTSYQYPPRWYNVPKSFLKTDKNLLVVKVVNSSGNGGFVLEKTYELKTSGNTINLKGDWKYKKGNDMPELESQTFIRWKPMGLYNAMISPLINYSKKGIIWYQGESNVSHPENYSDLVSSMVKDWRLKSDQAELPFLFVQLPNFQESVLDPVESKWAELREEQRKLSSLPNSGMVVAIDLGEWNDIHPLNKKGIADRLSKLAQQIVYQEKGLNAQAPQPVKSSLVNKNLKVQFTAEIKTMNNEPPAEFAVASEDGIFHRVSAQISANYVILNVENIAFPKFVRYAWADNPYKANLCDSDNNMVSPFQIIVSYE